MAAVRGGLRSGWGEEGSWALLLLCAVQQGEGCCSKRGRCRVSFLVGLVRGHLRFHVQQTAVDP